MIANPAETPTIFGLRYLEEEAAEIQDIVGCVIPIYVETATSQYTHSGCDDSDTSYDSENDAGSEE